VSRPHPALRRLKALAAAAPAAMAGLEKEDSLLAPLLRDLDASDLVSDALLAPLLAVADGAAALAGRLDRARRLVPASRRAPREGPAVSRRIAGPPEQKRFAGGASAPGDPERVAALLRRYEAGAEELGAPDRRRLPVPEKVSPASVPDPAGSPSKPHPRPLSRRERGGDAGRVERVGGAGRAVDVFAARHSAVDGNPARRSPPSPSGRGIGGEASKGTPAALETPPRSSWLAPRVARAGAGADLPVLVGATAEAMAEEVGELPPLTRPAMWASLPELPDPAPRPAGGAGAAAAAPAAERLAAVLARLRTGSRATGGWTRRRADGRGGPETTDPPSGDASGPATPPFPPRGGLRALAALGPSAPPALRRAPGSEPLAETAGDAPGPGDGPAAADLFQEDLASHIDRLLRREARRHGIEVDEP